MVDDDWEEYEGDNYCGICNDTWDMCVCENEESDPEYDCVKCGEPDCSCFCDACGSPLCIMHSELGAGFCGMCDIKSLMEERYRQMDGEE